MFIAKGNNKIKKYYFDAHSLLFSFPFTVQMKLLLDSLLNTHIFTQTYLFRMLLVESARLIFGTSSLVGLGQEGQRSNKKQAKFQFSEQTSPPFEVI